MMVCDSSLCARQKGVNNVIDQRHVVEVMGSKHLIMKGTETWTWAWMEAWV